MLGIVYFLSFWITILITIIISKFNVTHPYIWFSGFFTLYSTDYSIIYILGYPTDSGYSKEGLLFSLIALIVPLLFCGIHENNN